MPQFIWTIRNNINKPVQIIDLNLFITAGEIVNLHDRFPLRKLEDSKSLVEAISQGLVEEIHKEIYYGETVVPKETDLTELRKELTEVKRLVSDRKPGDIKIQAAPASGLTRDDIADLFESAKSAGFDSLKEEMKAMFGQIKNLGVPEEELPDGFQDKTPDEIATEYLTKDNKKIGEGGKIQRKMHVQEKVSDSSSDDLADLLADL